MEKSVIISRLVSGTANFFFSSLVNQCELYYSLVVSQVSQTWAHRSLSCPTRAICGGWDDATMTTGTTTTARQKRRKPELTSFFNCASLCPRGLHYPSILRNLSVWSWKREIVLLFFYVSAAEREAASQIFSQLKVLLNLQTGKFTRLYSAGLDLIAAVHISRAFSLWGTLQ